MALLPSTRRWASLSYPRRFAPLGRGFLAGEITIPDDIPDGAIRRWLDPSNLGYVRMMKILLPCHLFVQKRVFNLSLSASTFTKY